MSAIDELADEINRHLNADAGGDPAHPGARLRVLMLWNISEGEQRACLEWDIYEAGFMPVPDRFDQESEQRFCSLESVARAIGASVSVVATEVDKFLASDIGRRMGFSREVLFPESDECCSLH